MRFLFPWIPWSTDMGATLQSPRGLNTGQLGLTFASIAIGLCLVAACTPIIYRSYLKAERNEREATGDPNASPPPEERLWVAMILGWCMPISLFWL